MLEWDRLASLVGPRPHKSHLLAILLDGKQQTVDGRYIINFAE